jgi:hypothetical protein
VSFILRQNKIHSKGLYLKPDRRHLAGIFSFSIAPPLHFATKTQTGMSVLLSRQTKV